MTDRLLLLLLLLVVTKPAASACSDESSSLLCATKLVRRLTGSENPTYKVYDSNEVPGYSSTSRSHINYNDDEKKLGSSSRREQLVGVGKKAPNATTSNSRQHKAFFVDYPALQRVYQDKPSQKSKPKKQKKPMPESDIYFIKLPPSPYSYVPGLGYISQPPSFSATSLLQSTKKKTNNPFINLPIDFVSNGKPTSIYRTKDSPMVRLNRGPYVFDGRPSGPVYLLKKTSKKKKKIRPKVLYR